MTEYSGWPVNFPTPHGVIYHKRSPRSPTHSCLPPFSAGCLHHILQQPVPCGNPTFCSAGDPSRHSEAPTESAHRRVGRSSGKGQGQRYQQLSVNKTLRGHQGLSPGWSSPPLLSCRQCWHHLPPSRATSSWLSHTAHSEEAVPRAHTPKCPLLWIENDQQV